MQDANWFPDIGDKVCLRGYEETPMIVRHCGTYVVTVCWLDRLGQPQNAEYSLKMLELLEARPTE